MCLHYGYFLCILRAELGWLTRLSFLAKLHPFPPRWFSEEVLSKERCGMVLISGSERARWAGTKSCTGKRNEDLFVSIFCVAFELSMASAGRKVFSSGSQEPCWSYGKLEGGCNEFVGEKSW